MSFALGLANQSREFLRPEEASDPLANSVVYLPRCYSDQASGSIKFGK